jgi:hypothetical protein
MAYDSYGGLSVNTEGRKPSFSVVANSISLAATATDYFTLSNPATSNKIFRVTFVRSVSTSTANNTPNVYFYKRTTSNTGGTTSTLTPTYYDTNNPTVSGVAVSYSANPSALGTGTLVYGSHAFSSSGTTNISPIELTFGQRPSQCLALRPGELFAANFGGQTVPGGFTTFLVVEWTEEILSYT